jgi:glycosyltransferase involved in cell wall biosynthesis
VVVSAFFAGVPGGIVGVAMAYLASNVVTAVPGIYFACKLIDLAWTKFLSRLIAPVVCTLGMCPVVYAFAHWMSPYGDLPVLIVASCMGALAYFIYYLMFFRKVMLELLRVVLGNKVSSRLGSATSASATRTWLLLDIAPNFGGHEVMLLRWIEELRRSDSVVPVLVCLQGSRLAEQASGICEVMLIQPQQHGRSGKLKFFLRLTALLIRSRFKLQPELAVVAEGSLFAQRFGLYAARFTGFFTVMYVPLVSSFSTMGIPDGASLDRRVIRFYSKLPHAWLTITEDQAKEFRAWAQIRQPIFTLPNTVHSRMEVDCTAVLDRQRLSAGSLDRQSDARMRVLVLGRLEPHQKGLDLLLQHLVRQPELAAHFVINFAGEGPFFATLQKAKQEDPRLDQLVALEPWTDSKDVFARHDALLLPSRFEGVPLVMLEAMALGMPVVASDLAGTRGYLPTNCLHPVGELGLMFDCLATLHASRIRRLRIARRNLLAFKARASGVAFADAVHALTLQLRQVRHAG